jgi:hypothetical protein
VYRLLGIDNRNTTPEKIAVRIAIVRIAMCTLWNSTKSYPKRNTPRERGREHGSERQHQVPLASITVNIFSFCSVRGANATHDDGDNVELGPRRFKLEPSCEWSVFRHDARRDLGKVVVVCALFSFANLDGGNKDQFVPSWCMWVRWVG